MSMTDLFVELVVIGVGASVWVLLLIFSAFGYTWLPYDQLGSPLLLLPALSLVYVLGIIIDYLANQIFRLWAHPLRLRHFKDHDAYHKARTYVYSHAQEAVIDLFKYGRSRMHICRSWSLIWALLALTAPIFVWTRLPQLGLSAQISLSLVSLLGLGACSLVTWLAWRRLVGTDYRRLAETYVLLVKEQGSGRGEAVGKEDL
ncbi:MAG: hypothetical protein JXA37_03825 [Chloroflexia bacterium]|nr:hypothetical protein [Chloroflexia bacterium]